MSVVIIRRSAAALAAGALVLLAACAGDDVTGLSAGRTDAMPTPPAVPDTTAAPNAVNPLAALALFVDPASHARATADAWRATRPDDAALMDRIATQPQARWFGDWSTDVRAAVDSWVSVAARGGGTALLVAYNIPHRDCSGYSAGGANGADAYRAWITAFADGIGARRVAVVLEPDALAGMDCLSSAEQQVRLDLMRYAVATLVAKGSVSVYLDAGHPGWHGAATMAARLVNAGVASAAGFALNVANFFRDADNIAYGEQISAAIGGKHFIVDSGRNGLGPTADHQWCNPDGRALGRRPTTATNHPLVDAYLWVKPPGESDGSCNGAPAAGTWMPEYALGLAQRASY